jgi:pentatricopeptide repeat protein
VTWTAMMQAYSIHEQGEEAMKLFTEMQRVGIVPNEFTYSVILTVIANLTNLPEGKRIHTQLKVYNVFAVMNY